MVGDQRRSQTILVVDFFFREIATEGLQNLQQKFGICRRTPVSSKVAHKLRKVSAQVLSPEDQFPMRAPAGPASISELGLHACAAGHGEGAHYRVHRLKIHIDRGALAANGIREHLPYLG